MLDDEPFDTTEAVFPRPKGWTDHTKHIFRFDAGPSVRVIVRRSPRRNTLACFAMEDAERRHRALLHYRADPLRSLDTAVGKGFLLRSFYDEGAAEIVETVLYFSDDNTFFILSVTAAAYELNGCDEVVTHILSTIQRKGG